MTSYQNPLADDYVEKSYQSVVDNYPDIMGDYQKESRSKRSRRQDKQKKRGNKQDFHEEWWD